jgi:outer membrane protein assembly factor BamD
LKTHSMMMNWRFRHSYGGRPAGSLDPLHRGQNATEPGGHISAGFAFSNRGQYRQGGRQSPYQPSSMTELYPRVCLRLATLFLTGAILASCSVASSMRDLLSGGDGDKAALEQSGSLAPDASTPDDAAVAELYNDGLSNLSSGNYRTANKKFAEVERRHPYSKWATKAILMQAFASYQGRSYDDAINSSKRFIALHPGHKDTPYAYYLAAISEFDQIQNVERDQSRTEKALASLDEVSQRFPDSKYASDARQKALLARDRLAAKEMEVGRYYLKRGSYLAGINRFKKVVTDYQTTSQTPEALYRLTEAYMSLGVVSEAQTAAAVLGHNFPNSTWYRDAYTLVSSDGRAPVANESSWIVRAFKRVTG